MKQPQQSPAEATRARRVLAVVGLAVFLSILDLFIVNIAFPAIRADFGGASVGEPVGRVLSAPSLQAHNTPQDLHAVAPRPLEELRLEGPVLVVELPAHSFATVELPLR